VRGWESLPAYAPRARWTAWFRLWSARSRRG